MANNYSNNSYNSYDEYIEYQVSQATMQSRIDIETAKLQVELSRARVQESMEKNMEITTRFSSARNILKSAGYTDQQINDTLGEEAKAAVKQLGFNIV